MLALVVAALTLTLAYPLRSYLGQRAEIAKLRERVAHQQEQVAALEAARQRWRDPAYVRAQARSRLHYVDPGEIPFVVLDPQEAPAPDRSGPGTVSPGADGPWYAQLWRSVEQAAHAPTNPQR